QKVPDPIRLHTFVFDESSNFNIDNDLLSRVSDIMINELFNIIKDNNDLDNNKNTLYLFTGTHHFYRSYHKSNSHYMQIKLQA
ncbi:20839_t:CDS:2, partial [Racocetra persica]